MTPSGEGTSLTEEPEPAQLFLWDLQGSLAGAHAGPTPDPKQRMEELFHRIAKEFNPRATTAQLGAELKNYYDTPKHWPPCGPHENFAHYRMIQTLADEIERPVEGLPRPILGTLATGEINAITLKVPGSTNHVVAIEDQLFPFALLFSKAVALAIPVINSTTEGGFDFHIGMTQVRGHLKENPEAVQRFQEVILAYILDGKPGKAPRYTPPSHVISLASPMIMGLELFVLGHEYGHIMAGHLADGAAPRRLRGTEDVDVTEISWSWQQELDADAVGWTLSMAAMIHQGSEPPATQAGIELFFSACEILEKALSVLTTGEVDRVRRPTSHPHPRLRRDTLRESISNIQEEEVERAKEIGECIAEVVEELWRHTEPLILKLHHAGESPDTRWL